MAAVTEWQSCSPAAHHDDSQGAPLDAVPLQLGVHGGHGAAAVQGHEAQRLELCGGDGPPGGQGVAGCHDDDHLVLQPGGHLRQGLGLRF